MGSYILSYLGEENNRFILKGEKFDLLELIFQDDDVIVSNTFEKVKLYFVQDSSNIGQGIFTFYSHTSGFLGHFKKQTSLTIYIKDKKNDGIPATIFTGIPILWLFSMPYYLKMVKH